MNCYKEEKNIRECCHAECQTKELLVVTDEKLVEEIIERPIKPEARSRAGPERPGLARAEAREDGRAYLARLSVDRGPARTSGPAEAWWQGAAEAERASSQELGTSRGVSRQAATPVD